METILIFAGGDIPPQEVTEDLPAADLILAADSGYDAAMALGYRVDVLIGDLDSIQTTPLPDHVIVEKYPADKDQTDLELSLELAIRDDPSRIVVVGGAGNRHDHELATTQMLCSDRWGGVDELDWLTARSRSYVLHRRRLIHGDVGSTISLIPIGSDVSGVSTRGLKWELANETLHLGTTRGISNVMKSPVADIKVEEGTLLVVQPTPQP